MKIIVQACVIFAIVAIAYSASTSWGIQNATDSLVLSKNVVYPAIRNTAQTHYFSIPQSYQSNNKLISAIYLQDQFINGSGPTNSLIWGGPGWTYATIQMRTQSNSGLNVTVVVYGK